MTAKILLVRPDYKSHIITPPLGLGYLASYLKSNGFEAKILDGLRDSADNQALFRRIVSERPDAVGLTCLTAFYKEVVDLSKLVKKANIRCIIGGVHPTFLPHETLIDSDADYVICGEGEIPLVRLLENNFLNKNIPGVYSRDDFEIHKRPFIRAEIIENLDDVPFPDWEQIDPRLYPKAPYGALVKRFPIGSIMTTRGCPYECTFCASPQLYDRRIRFRSPENVLEEVEYLIERFDVKEIQFIDDNFTFRREHVVQICNGIGANGIDVPWSCPTGIRADRVDEELVKLMAKSGCYCFAFGIESANPTILKNIKKHETIEIIEKSIEMASGTGISCNGFFVFGLPGETPQTIDQTIRFAKRSKLNRAQFLILDVIPGSELWYTLEGQFKPNWEKASFREPEWMPEGLSKEQLMKAQARAFRQFYLRPSILLGLAGFIKLGQIKYLVKRLRDYRITKLFGSRKNLN